MPSGVYQNTPFLWILIPFAGGILLSKYLPGPHGRIWVVMGLSIGFLLFSCLKGRLGTAAFLPGILFAGFMTGSKPDIPDPLRGYFTARICTDLIPVSAGYRTVIDRIRFIDPVHGCRLRGKASVYLLAPVGMRVGQSQRRSPEPGSILLAGGKLSPYGKPLNPRQFDYGAFQLGRGIHYQAYLDSIAWITTGLYARTGIRIESLKLRGTLLDELDGIGLGTGQRSILQALLLGYRGEMDPGVKRNFSFSGSMHVLAVSGLHVGIIYLLPLVLLKRLRAWRPVWIGGMIFILLGLWLYAFLTGLSASVIRAVTMCSVHGLAKIARRNVPPLHVLSMSAFLMILVRPAILFEAGFQLSFAAVAGIIYMYPRLLSLFPLPGRAGRWISGMLAVSLAAQLSTIPLTIYYFHRIAPASILSNLVIIPLATGMLYVGLAFFLSGAFPAMPDCINDLTGTMLDGASAFMHCLTSWMAAQSWSHLEGLSLTWIQVALLYAIGILLFHYLENKVQRVQQWLGILVICYLGFSICREFRILSHRGIYVFALKGESAIAFVEGRKCYLSADYCRRDSILPYGMESFFRYYKLNRPVCIDSGEEPGAILYRFDDKRMLVLNALEGCSFEGLPALDGGPVVLRNNPKADIHELEKKCNPGIIVADGSNRYYYIRKMESNCREAGIEFHSTRSNGYFVY